MGKREKERENRGKGKRRGRVCPFKVNVK